MKLVNKNLIQLYWDIGKEICERQECYGWGKGIVEDLALELKEAFSGKTGFSARNLWRMRNFYLTALDEQEKLPEENSSIGIIICRNKNRTVVEYALKSATVPMGVATYKISNELPEEMEKLLPGPEEIARKLEEIDG